MTHTPGPWRWRTSRVDNGATHCFLESARPPDECSCRDVTVLAVREDWAGTYGDTTRAKYRRQFDRDLIVAAPDMLAALKGLVGLTSEGAMFSERIEAARAAIEKAEGNGK